MGSTDRRTFLKLMGSGALAASLPASIERALAVPADAVQQVEGRDVIFVRKAATQFEAREVKTGKLINGLLEITSGLREGEPVVVQSAFHLKSIWASKGLGEE